jgi:signal transduction histidine kinase
MLESDCLRVLILLGTERDSEACAKTLTLSECEAVICKDVTDLCSKISDGGAGVLLVGTEVLTEDSLAPLMKMASMQPAWSQMSIVMLLNAGEILTSVDPSYRQLEPLCNVTMLEEPVRLSSLISIVRSAIAYRRRQYQQRDLLAQLEQSRREAVEADRAKSDFLANMSHEIRTPLGAVMGFSELLMEPGLSERERQVYMTAIRRNGQMLSALVDDILDLAKVEAGRIEIEHLEFSLSELLAEAVSSLEPQASRKGLPLILERAPDTPEMIRTDPIRLKQILMNIIGNAIKFTSVGAVNVRLEGRNTSPSNVELRVEIEDSGIGISSSQSERLFQPFTQADTSTTRRFGGTGLGLVLSRRLAQALGGNLALKWSVPGGGSCFEIVLPVESLPEGEVSESTVETETTLVCAGPLQGRHILVVDDSLDNQLLIGRTLKLLGAHIELANDGLEAVHKAMEKSYDVVLMDLQMPRLGGVEATRILREKGFTQPIVALTAHAMKEDRQRCLRVGCTDYLTKPIQRAHLVRVLEKVARAVPG